MFPRLTSNQFLVMVILLIGYGLIVFWGTRAYYQPEMTQAAVPAYPQGSSLRDTMANLPLVTKSTLQAVNDDPVALARMADELFSSRQYIKAATAYRRLVELEPNNVETYNNLGLTLQYLGGSGEALQYLEQGTRVDPSFQRIWLTLGFVRANMGQYNDARSAFDQVIELGAETGIGVEAARMKAKLP